MNPIAPFSYVISWILTSGDYGNLGTGRPLSLVELDQTNSFPSTAILALTTNLGVYNILLRKDQSFVGGALATEDHADPDCYFSATVIGYERSHGAVNLCDAEINGFIQLDPLEYFIIESQINDNSTHKHGNKEISLVLITQPSSTKDQVSSNPSNFIHAARYRRNIPLSSTREYPDYYQQYTGAKMRYVELVLVHDNGQWHRLGQNSVKVISRSKQIVNIINSLYYPLNIRFALVNVEIWKKEDQIAITENGDDTLNNFLYYRRRVLLNKADPGRYTPNDNAQLLTNVRFRKGVVGKALRGGMCSYKNSGGVNVDAGQNAISVATTLAHEIGHNFGMEHDTSDCECPHSRCIMSAATGAQYPPGIWSSCSLRDLAWALSHGSDLCLRNEPPSTRLFQSPTCGNGITEPGEECDCGFPEVCKNHCCNANTCRLQHDALCGSGMCCDLSQCKPKKRSTTCREATNECDLPEYCDGHSSVCPDDYHAADGISCKSDKAFCSGGKCNSHEDQCQLIWGDSGSPSEQQCYDLNQRGDVYGNCGHDRVSDSFTACMRKDRNCGMLHCIHQAERAEFGDKSVVLTAHTFIPRGRLGGEDKIICRNALIDLGLSNPDPGLVPNGAKCGVNKMCEDHKCVHVENVLSKRTCDDPDCNFQGVCNMAGYCHCDPGFAPPFCISSGRGGSEVSGPPPVPSYGFNLGVGVSVFIFIVIPLITLLVTLWYRRRRRCLLAKGPPPITQNRARPSGSRHVNTGSFFNRLFPKSKFRTPPPKPTAKQQPRMTTVSNDNSAPAFTRPSGGPIGAPIRPPLAPGFGKGQSQQPNNHSPPPDPQSLTTSNQSHLGFRITPLKISAPIPTSTVTATVPRIPNTVTAGYSNPNRYTEAPLSVVPSSPQPTGPMYSPGGTLSGAHRPPPPLPEHTASVVDPDPIPDPHHNYPQHHPAREYGNLSGAQRPAPRAPTHIAEAEKATLTRSASGDRQTRPPAVPPKTAILPPTSTDSTNELTRSATANFAAPTLSMVPIDIDSHDNQESSLPQPSHGRSVDSNLNRTISGLPAAVKTKGSRNGSNKASLSRTSSTNGRGGPRPAYKPPPVPVSGSSRNPSTDESSGSSGSLPETQLLATSSNPAGHDPHDSNAHSAFHAHPPNQAKDTTRSSSDRLYDAVPYSTAPVSNAQPNTSEFFADVTQALTKRNGDKQQPPPLGNKNGVQPTLPPKSGATPTSASAHSGSKPKLNPKPKGVSSLKAGTGPEVNRSPSVSSRISKFNNLNT